MQAIEHLPKINPKTTKELIETTNHQSLNRTDYEYSKMIHGVLKEVFPLR